MKLVVKRLIPLYMYEIEVKFSWLLYKQFRIWITTKEFPHLISITLNINLSVMRK